MAALQSQLMSLPSRRPVSGDALIASSLAAVMAVTAVTAGGSPVALRLAGAVAACGLLALVKRRRRPLLVLVVAFVVVFSEQLAAPHAFEVATFLAIMVAAYSLGAYASRRDLVLGVALGVPGVVIGHSLGRQTHYSDASADAFFFAILVAGPVLVGRIVRARAQLTSRLQEATERLAAARAARVAASVTADRAQLSVRIDAALLDGLGRMVALADCETLEQVSALERIARDMLGELRSLLRDLRAGMPSREPATSLSDLRARVQRAIDAEDAPSASRGLGAPAPKRWTLMSPQVIDAALAIAAVVLAAGLLVDTLGQETLRGPRWVDALAAVAAAAPIAWARRNALPAAAASIAMTFAYAALAAPADPESGLLPVGMLVVFPLALGASCPAAKATVGLALCLAATGLADTVDPSTTFDPSTVAPGFALVVGAWTAGRVLRHRSRMLSALADTADAIEDERASMARAAVAAERARAARELHDAVAHAMTVIVLQSGAARRVWDSNPELAAQHVEILHETVCQLVAELRAMLVELGAGNDADTTGFEQLIDRARAAGLRVKLGITGERESLPPPIQHTGFRILQEALTNAARHAPGADVLVKLEFRRGGLALEVSNQASALVDAANDGSGQGLTGMRERVEACGGWLTAGTQPPDRFAVQAWLPRP